MINISLERAIPKLGHTGIDKELTWLIAAIQRHVVGSRVVILLSALT